MSDDVARVAAIYKVPVDTLSLFMDGFRQIVHGDTPRRSVQEAYCDLVWRVPSSKFRDFRAMMLLTTRWPIATTHPDFHCFVCGAECDGAPDLPARAVCPAHCFDHHFEYDPWERENCCTICGHFPEND